MLIFIDNSMWQKIRTYGFVFLAVIVLSSCKSTSKSVDTEKDFSYLYNPVSMALHPVAQVMHINDSISELIVKVFPDELLFNMANVDAVSRAYITMTFQYREIADNGELAAIATDSVSMDYILDKEEVGKRYYITVLFKAERGKKYYLTVNLKDKNRNANASCYSYVDKSDNFGPQNFRMLYERTQQLVYDPKVVGNERILVSHSNPEVSKMFVKYYANYQEAANPPSLQIARSNIYNNYDSLYTINFNGLTSFNPQHEGLYLFQVDTTVEKGCHIMCFYDNFPKVEDGLQLARPLQYLESKPGFVELMKSKNKKLSVDRFWLSLSDDNIERARQLIRIYYNRVFYANYYFTSFTEGWMTDRGMVFIIYGQPNHIEKKYNSEIWSYKGGSMGKAVKFNFILDEGPFGFNDYVLQRGASATYWNEAIQSWNNGQVFTFDNYFNK